MRSLSMSVSLTVMVSSLSGCGMFGSSGASVFYDECVTGGEKKELCRCTADYLEEKLSDEELDLLGIMMTKRDKMQSIGGLGEVAAGAGLSMQEFMLGTTIIGTRMQAARMSCK
ncbi:hypothetical protein MNBD_GAMMA15-300 [hydrothermal vent metagenome]|uniref:Lipoprotein n=1 Tax=hydrothermal vent metagenome TaxID=652676 RepID=A0A3B0YE93_9ZZZZ